MQAKSNYSKLETLFNPRSIAIIGASNTRGKVGHSVMKNLLDAKFAGEIIPINIKETRVQGKLAYKSVLEVPTQVELAMIIVPAPVVEKVLKDCAKKKIKNVIIITAGFSETGEEGKKLEEKIRKVITENKMRAVGPNTLGIINTSNSLNASFAANPALKGKIALVSQSGAICTAILDWARKEKIGFSKFISTGNKLSLNETHYFDYLENDEETTAVLVYMEAVKDAQEFVKKAYSLAKKKPVVVLKSGRTSAGQKAAASHTGAMSVDDDIFTSACKKANIIRVNTIEEFFDFAKLFSQSQRITAFRAGVITNAGGLGVLAADYAEMHKIELAKLSARTIKAVQGINAHAHNPLDLIGDARPSDYSTGLIALQQDQNIDFIYALLTPQSMTDPEKVSEIIVSLNNPKPIICSFIGGTAVNLARQKLIDAGVLEFETPERGMRVLSLLKEYHLGKDKAKLFEAELKPSVKIKNMFKKKDSLEMEEAFKLLKEFGIKTPKTQFIRNAKEITGLKLNYPVAVKAACGLAHKTDYGLIKAGVKDAKELEKVSEQMLSKLSKLKLKKVLAVQEIINGKEVLVSALHSEFGSIITYGLGGIFVEVMKDYSQKIAPLNETDFEEMFLEVKGTKVLTGARTKKKYAVDALKRAIKAVSLLSLTYPQIKELELNPVIVTEKGAFAVDAVIRLK